MDGGRVLQAMALILLLLGGVAIGFQLTGDAPPVVWLGAIGPVVMGIGLLVIARAIRSGR